VSLISKTLTAIPNSFNPKELERMLENALPEGGTVDPNGDFSEEQIIEFADKYVSGVLQECNTPVVHKAMIVNIVNNFIRWHVTMAEKMLDDGEMQSAAAWQRDAGKFQAIVNILLTINVGDDDFMTE